MSEWPSGIGLTEGMTEREQLEFRRRVRDMLSSRAAEIAPHIFNTLQMLAFGQPEKRDAQGRRTQEYIKPDKWALEMLIERVWPIKLPQTFSFKMQTIKSAADVGKAMDDVLAAAAAGELPFDEAQKMIKALELRLKAYESGELAEKMAALQAMAEKIAADRGIVVGQLPATKSRENRRDN